MKETTPLAALNRRADHFVASDTDSYRLLNRTADGVPNLAVDKFNDVLIANLYSQGQPGQAPLALLKQVQTQTGARSVYIKYRPKQASRLTDAQRAALAPAEPLLGEKVEETVATENGTRYFIRPLEGLSVGLFLDMREQRAWVKKHAAGRTVLNCFAYTCAFGLVAQQGGAQRAVNLDVSKPYLDWGKRNAELNDLSVDPKDYIFGDVFDWLKRFARSGQKFDLVILDPPAFSTTKQTRFSVDQDYNSLIALAATVTTPGGCILACANAAELPAPAFKTRLQAGLQGYPSEIVSLSHEPAVDFPLAPGREAYLKCARIRLKT
jgi:23S rRNA (cytosine1962-C5)-methyltransferase